MVRAPGGANDKSSLPIRRGSRYLSALKTPAALLCLFGVAIAGYYFVYVKQQTRYVVGRNFRVLATLGGELQATVDSGRTVIRSFLKHPEVLADRGCDTAGFKSIAEDFAPLLRSIQIDGWDCQSKTAKSLLLRFQEPSGTAWRFVESVTTPNRAAASADLNLIEILQPLLSGETQQDLFASIALTTTRGRVIFQTGDPHLQVADFSQLPLRTEGAKDSQTFAQLSNSPTLAELDLGGLSYAFFIQPCCHGMTIDGSAPNPSGWVIGGLIPQRELRSAGTAFPTSVVLAISVTLLVAVFGWPFLKLVLIGDQQRVRAHDVLLVGVCGLLGLSLLTIATLDLYSYQRLTGALDDQLKVLAGEVIAQASAEVTQADQQLRTLERLALQNTDNTRVENLAEAMGVRSEDLGAYPFFSSFALIEKGQQKTKWTLASFLTPPVDVSDREYVTHWAVHRPAEQFFLDSIRSRTTGTSEAIVSKPMVGDDGSGGVSALTIPLQALLNPVIVPGFGYAVIDDDGRVIFHSDSEHNLSESFFAETDSSRRLRALVTARHEELLDLRYWGEDHRAFVTPMDIDGRSWSLVTFYDKPLIRTLHMESLISAVFYTLILGSIFVLVAAGLLVFKPAYRAPWMWPDASNTRTYLRLVVSYMALGAAFVVALVTFSLDQLLWTSWLLPLLACSLTIFVLRDDAAAVAGSRLAAAFLLLLALAVAWAAGSSRAAIAFDLLVLAACSWAVHVAWSAGRPSITLAPPLNLSYGIAATLLVFLIAVVPAAGFFKVAHAIHTQNLIQYGQLALSNSLIARREADERADRRQITDRLWTTIADLKRQWRNSHPDVGTYYAFFFNTSRVPCTPSPGSETRGDGERQPVPAFLEELLPFYSESSVKLRELMHGGADDKRWTWSSSDGELTLCVPVKGVEGNIGLRSSLLPFVGGSTPNYPSPWWLLLGGAVVVAGAVVLIIQFVMRRIFVVEVIEPLWSGRAVPAAVPAPGLLVLNRTRSANGFLRPAQYHVVDLEDSGRGDTVQRQWSDGQLDEIRKLPEDRNVLILHFEHSRADPVFDELKLRFVEHLVVGCDRTVVIVSAVPFDRVFQETALSQEGAQSGTRTQRWASLRAACTVIPSPPPESHRVQPPQRPQIDWRPAGVSELLWRVNAMRFSRQARFLERERRDPFIESQWQAVLPFAWQADTRAPMDLEQLLIEVGDRAENYYEALWQSCSTSERLVLGHVAKERLINEKCSRIVRGLMVRGLVDRQPNFDVMNETFRRFVSARPFDEDVVGLETRRSTWDSVRVPFMLLVGATAAVFFTTQQEIFQQTVGVVTAVTTALPMLVKVVSLMSGKSSPTAGA